MIGSVKKGSAHGILTGLGCSQDEALRFVRMFDRDASGRWEDKTFIFKSDKLRETGKREVVIAGMLVRWPKLVVKFED